MASKLVAFVFGALSMALIVIMVICTFTGTKEVIAKIKNPNPKSLNGDERIGDIEVIKTRKITYNSQRNTTHD